MKSQSYKEYYISILLIHISLLNQILQIIITFLVMTRMHGGTA